MSLVYNNVMSRPPDQGGLDYWTWLLESRQLTRGLVMLSFSESAEFKERIGVWMSPPAAGEPQRLPQSVPVTMHPGRISEIAGPIDGGIYLNYDYPSTVSLEEIFVHHRQSRPCCSSRIQRRGTVEPRARAGTL